MYNYIIVNDIEIYKEIISVFEWRSEIKYDIIETDKKFEAKGLGITYIMPHPNHINNIPIHTFIKTIYTSDECIVPSRYVLATYKAGKGYNMIYLEELEI